jgi:DNA-binding transcriptional regulator YdaS (Cro superfamily)
MHLKEWLKVNCIKQVQFADMVGYKYTYLSNCITGLRKPGKKFIAAIEKNTCGKVTKLDWADKKKENPDQMDLFGVRDEKGKFIRKKS